MLWRLMPVLAAALVLGGGAYIVVRTHRFGFMRALAQRHKLLSWLLALIPMGLVGLFGLAFNVTAMTVVFLHLLLAWLFCDGVWLIVKPHLKKPVQHYWAGAAALALTVLYLGMGWFFAHHVYETDRSFTTDKDLGGEGIRIFAGADSLECTVMVKKLKELFGIQRLMLAGGGVMDWSFAQEGLIDELSIVLAPVADGDRAGASLFERAGFYERERPAAFSLLSAERRDGGVLYR